jgi:hypothetical protein
MNRAGKVIALTIALTGGLWVYSYASPGDAQTYVSGSGSIDFALDGPSSFSLVQHHEDSIRVDGADSIKLRDPNYAIFVALVPGAVVHGAGHFYAGKVRTGFILLGCELVGAGLVYLGGVTGVESGEPSSGGKVAMATGVTLFYGSWAYDLVFAPLSIKKRNEELLLGKHTHLEFRINHGDVRVITVWRF